MQLAELAPAQLYFPNPIHLQGHVFHKQKVIYYLLSTHYLANFLKTLCLAQMSFVAISVSPALASAEQNKG